MNNYDARYCAQLIDIRVDACIRITANELNFFFSCFLFIILFANCPDPNPNNTKWKSVRPFGFTKAITKPVKREWNIYSHFLLLEVEAAYPCLLNTDGIVWMDTIYGNFILTDWYLPTIPTIFLRCMVQLNIIERCYVLLCSTHDVNHCANRFTIITRLQILYVCVSYISI